MQNVKMTPMLLQWQAAKEKAKDAIVLFRMGDFYELFAQDAEIAAPILELTLTSRDKDKENAMPMAGFPHQAAPAYIAKLIGAGHKVAICDQMEDPKTAKGIVKRDITRIVTPGTVLDDDTLKQSVNNFLVAVYASKEIGLAALDVSTGDFWATASSSMSAVIEEILRVGPAELVISGDESMMREVRHGLVALHRMRIEEQLVPRDLVFLSKLPVVDTLFTDVGQENAKIASEMILSYVAQMQGEIPEHIQAPRPFSIDAQLLLDVTTRRHLEVMGPAGDLRKTGTLLAIVDKTKTAMGARFLAKLLTSPSTDIHEIGQRHDMVETLLNEPGVLQALRASLRHVYDMERLTARCASGRATPRDMAGLRQSLQYLPVINNDLAVLAKTLDPLNDVYDLLSRALVDNPPQVLKDGGIFQAGYDAVLDELVALSSGGRDQIAAIEQREREVTGISSLKVGYTRVFGYYIEVTRTHLAKVPEHFKRKQTIANGERYITDELVQLEEKVASADVRRLNREVELFHVLLEQVKAQTRRLMTTAKIIAEIDAMASFAQVADEQRFVRPKLLPKEKRSLWLKDSRHPVVEILQQASSVSPFVPNDIMLTGEEYQIALITGPNMGGKSTIMRQVALSQILAQAGSFVPASEAVLSICDRIFTRVGASDDVSSGRSTFMVEMSETAQILRHATPYSLVLLDEIGRGTSTFDGLSIAWSVAEYLHDAVGARAFFATHYHELTEIAKSCVRVVNKHVGVLEKMNQITFLYLLKDGPAEQSYGVHVARLAGLPDQVLLRAEQILAKLENDRTHPKRVSFKNVPPRPQLDLFTAN